MNRIAIIDDHELFRKSLSFLVSSFRDIQVVYDSDNGYDFIEFIKNETLDLVLLDIQMPIVNGFEVCKILKSNNPHTKILIISQLNTKEAIHHVMECGANGFFSKSSSPLLLETAINRVINEGYYFNMSLYATIREAMLWDRKTNYIPDFNLDVLFSEREIQIIKMVCQEKSSDEIGLRLNITARTVETHRARIIKKVNAKNFIGAVLHALKTNAIHIEDL